MDESSEAQEAPEDSDSLDDLYPFGPGGGVLMRVCLKCGWELPIMAVQQQERWYLIRGSCERCEPEKA